MSFSGKFTLLIILISICQFEAAENILECGVGGISCIGKIPNMETDIDGMVESISGMVGSISGMVGSISKILPLVQNIPNILDTLEDGILSTIDDDDLSTSDLADELKKCVDSFKALPTEILPILDIINLPDLSSLGLDIDIDKIVYTVMAAQLLPFKNQIHYLCTDGIEEVMNIVSQFISTDIIKRRRLNENNITEKSKIFDDDALFYDEICQDTTGEFCYPFETKYPYQEQDYFPYLFMKATIPDMVEDYQQTTNANKILKYRYCLFTIEIIFEVADRACEFILACSSPSNIDECWKKAWCYPLLTALLIPLRVFQFALDQAEFHDDIVLSTQVDSIFKDRKNIIHNQIALRNLINELMLSTEQIDMEIRKKEIGMHEIMNDIHYNISNIWQMLAEQINPKLESVINLPWRRRLGDNATCKSCDCQQQHMLIQITWDQLYIGIFVILCIAMVMTAIQICTVKYILNHCKFQSSLQ